jgi:hypothetical protein
MAPRGLAPLSVCALMICCGTEHSRASAAPLGERRSAMSPESDARSWIWERSDSSLSASSQA